MLMVYQKSRPRFPQPPYFLAQNKTNNKTNTSGIKARPVFKNNIDIYFTKQRT